MSKNRKGIIKYKIEILFVIKYIVSSIILK
jgi:hypothetical protein